MNKFCIRLQLHFFSDEPGIIYNNISLSLSHMYFLTHTHTHARAREFTRVRSRKVSLKVLETVVWVCTSQNLRKQFIILSPDSGFRKLPARSLTAFCLRKFHDLAGPKNGPQFHTEVLLCRARRSCSYIIGDFHSRGGSNVSAEV